ncbi:MAG: MATE family efflux transporter [Spirochaetota bacterium]
MQTQENTAMTRTLLQMGMPVAIGMLMTFLFQLVDSYFIGKLGAKELAAISFSFPVYLLLLGFFMGAASGVATAIGKAIGENNTEKAKSISSMAHLAFMCFTILIGILGMYSITPVFTILGASSTQISLVSNYMFPLYSGMFLLVGGLVGNSVLLAKGLTKRATVIMGIGGVVNLLLDYLFIFGYGMIPRMELAGAAWATVISWFVIFFLMVVTVWRQDLISWRLLLPRHWQLGYLQEILQVSSPAILSQVMTPISVAVITRLVANLGEEYVAAYGIVSRIESLGLTGILSLSVIITPLSAQYLGGQRQDKLDAMVALAGRMTVYWGIGFYLCILAFSQQIVSIFSDNLAVIAQGQVYLQFVGISYPFFGLFLITVSFLNGVYQASSSLQLTFIKNLLCTIPLALLAAQYNYKVLCSGLAFANIAGAILAAKYLRLWMQQSASNLVNVHPLLDYYTDIKHFTSFLWRKIKL